MPTFGRRRGIEGVENQQLKPPLSPFEKGGGEKTAINGWTLTTAQLIIDTLNLDIEIDAIDPDDYFFGEGLALDSIDALELAMSITHRIEQKNNFQ